MSTLKTSNIQDTSGTNNSTPEEISQGRAKAWITFNGTGTVANRDKFNIDTITDNGTGDFSVAITNNMSIANYLKQVSHDDVLYGGMSYFHGDGSTAGSYRIMARVGHTTLPATYDNDMYAMTIGDLA